MGAPPPPRPPAAPPPRHRRGQRPERRVLQRAVSDDEQSLLFELLGDGAEQHSAQRGGGLRVLDVGLRDARSLFVSGFEFDGSVAGRQQTADAIGCLLNLFTRRQFVAGDRGFGHRPQITSLFVQSVFEQQGVIVERLPSDFRKAERLGLYERGVARAGGANLRFKPLILGFEILDLFSGRGGLFFAALAAEQSNQAVGFGFKTLLKRAFVRQQRRAYAVPNIGAGLGERFDQRAGARPFAGLEGGDGVVL